ncbi:kinase domain protein, putative (macronuclear) [Tetrahymena thermophila SB210]|uniref:Kinase domain protein, putative n=1 Tax=Tetrahymena thermophila (strain SB210) TaxID=312017 RepID=Q22GV9_TETTS|nr:kinase domain protein, putative [Tetrahymena thermophila SB210]EAR84565.3 kinase domain protein, putative [Tetrahymena thermophila SB210]|eukprot:XP_001032228.3 kinase domain protein, putative [Tetrahymena thermophila SB210]
METSCLNIVHQMQNECSIKIDSLQKILSFLYNQQFSQFRYQENDVSSLILSAENDKFNRHVVMEILQKPSSYYNDQSCHSVYEETSDNSSLTISPLEIYELDNFIIKEFYYTKYECSKSLVTINEVKGDNIHEIKYLKGSFQQFLMINHQFEPISKCINLQSLNYEINSNFFGTYAAYFLGNAISQCSKLQKLQLSINSHGLQQQDALYLVQSISNCTNLTKLSLTLNRCGLKTQGSAQFSEKIANLSSLTCLQLTLWSNNIDAHGACIIGQNLSKCKNLRRLSLDFQDNKIEDQGFLHLSHQISQLQMLKKFEIDLWKNNITSKGAYISVKALSYCQTITSLGLRLRSNKIDSIGAMRIGEELVNFTNLQNLSIFLSGNDTINTNGMKFLGRFISQCKKISVLNIDKYSNERKNISILNEKCKKALRLVKIC